MRAVRLEFQSWAAAGCAGQWQELLDSGERAFQCSAVQRTKARAAGSPRQALLVAVAVLRDVLGVALGQLLDGLLNGLRSRRKFRCWGSDTPTCPSLLDEGRQRGLAWETPSNPGTLGATREHRTQLLQLLRSAEPRPFPHWRKELALGSPSCRRPCAWIRSNSWCARRCRSCGNVATNVLMSDR